VGHLYPPPRQTLVAPAWAAGPEGFSFKHRWRLCRREGDVKYFLRVEIDDGGFGKKAAGGLENDRQKLPFRAALDSGILWRRKAPKKGAPRTTVSLGQSVRTVSKDTILFL